jgi:glycosyltransferase involved in cell wall biosynthesis
VDAPAVSVIVAARNSERGVERLLAALAAQTLARERFEVLLVDDCSTDATAEVARRSGIARVLSTPRRGGSYAARNVALPEARGEAIAITDADCVPAPDWLERGLEALATGADVAGGLIDVRLGERPTLAEVVDVARGLDQRRCVEEWGFAATANFFARRDVFERIGHFNERLVSGGDNELGQRATAAGLRLAYAPQARVEHAPRRRVRAVATKGYRVGFGGGQMPYVASGPARAWPRLWSTPRAWLPRRGLLGAERVEAAGYRLTPARRLVLDLAQHAFVQVPMIAGSLTATVRRGRAW